MRSGGCAGQFVVRASGGTGVGVEGGGGEVGYEVVVEMAGLRGWGLQICGWARTAACARRS